MNPILLVIAVFVSIALVSCNRSEEKHEKPEQSSAARGTQPGKRLVLTEEEIKAAGIRVESAQVQTIHELVTLTATILPNPRLLAKVAPRLPGRIASVAVEQGTRVEAGQLLAVLESSELGEARSAYLQAKSETALAEAALARAESLVREDIVPQKEYLRAQSDVQRARAALRAAEDKLRLLGVRPSGAVEREAFTALPLTAPFPGTIIERKAVVGELAQADQPLFTVANLDTVWLAADVFEKDLAKLATGVEASVAVMAYPNEVFSGRLTYLGDTMDTATRTVKARIEVPNPDRRLKPGMFATVVLQSKATVQAVLVPEQAVTLYQGYSAVFIETRGAIMPRAVEPGPVIGGKVAVNAGVSPGERIVVAGAYAVKSRLLKSQFATED